MATWNPQNVTVEIRVRIGDEPFLPTMCYGLTKEDMVYAVRDVDVPYPRDLIEEKIEMRRVVQAWLARRLGDSVRVYARTIAEIVVGD